MGRRVQRLLHGLLWLTVSGVTISSVSGACKCSDPTDITVYVFYKISCNSTTGDFTVSRDSPCVACDGCGGTDYSYVQPTSCSDMEQGKWVCIFCEAATDPFVEELSLTQAPSSCSPFSWSGTLPFGGALHCGNVSPER